MPMAQTVEWYIAQLRIRAQWYRERANESRQSLGRFADVMARERLRIIENRDYAAEALEAFADWLEEQAQ